MRAPLSLSHRSASSAAFKVACGQLHALALEENGTVFSWGCGDYGRLGHKDQKDIHIPTPLPGLLAREVACGTASSAAIGYQARLST